MTFYFANIRLEGREKYRIIVTAEVDHEYAADVQLPIEIRINEGSGSRRAPIHSVARVRFAGQKNVEFDFEAPEIATVTDLRVAVPAHFSVRTALLFVRHRFYAQEIERPSLPPQTAGAAPRVSEPLRSREAVEMLPVSHGEMNPASFRPPLQAQPAATRNSRGSDDEQASPQSRSAESPVTTPRRRRLE